MPRSNFSLPAAPPSQAARTQLGEAITVLEAGRRTRDIGSRPCPA